MSGVLGPTDPGDQGRRVLWTSVQGGTKVSRKATPAPHNFQCGCGQPHMPLGDGGDTNRGRNGRTWSDHHRPGGIFLCQRWPRGVDPTIEATEGV